MSNNSNLNDLFNNNNNMKNVGKTNVGKNNW